MLAADYYEACRPHRSRRTDSYRSNWEKRRKSENYAYKRIQVKLSIDVLLFQYSHNYYEQNKAENICHNVNMNVSELEEWLYLQH